MEVQLKMQESTKGHPSMRQPRHRDAAEGVNREGHGSLSGRRMVGERGGKGWRGVIVAWELAWLFQ